MGEAFVKILSGPNAGKTTPMTRAQFVFGRPGVTVAAIRRSGGSYRLVPLGGDSLPTVNGGTIAREGVELAFGDTIDVAGVKLRFSGAPDRVAAGPSFGTFPRSCFATPRLPPLVVGK